MPDAHITYTDDLIGRLVGRVDNPPCSHPLMSNACLRHVADRCLHRADTLAGLVMQPIAACATCRPLARSDNSGGSVGADGILTESQTMTRPGWDEWALGVAEAVSRRATCPRASIGVVLLDKDHHVVATGYNGANAGDPHCGEVGCRLYADHCTVAVHAEKNAVHAAQRMLASASPGSVWLKISLSSLDIQPYIFGPRNICSECARTMREAGITKEPIVRWPS